MPHSPTPSHDGDSVTQSGPSKVITSQYGTVTGVRVGRMVELSIDWESSAGESWGSGSFGTLPEGWRPCMKVTGTWSGRDAASQRQIIVETSGAMRYANMGGAQNAGGFNATIHFIAA